MLGTWVLGLFFVTRGVITLPALITFAGLMNFVAGPVQIISERYSSTIAASAVCKRVLTFLDAPTDEADSWGSEPLTQIKTVTLNDISCRRDDREILKHVDLTLQKGDRVALLGESGAGKSTLLKVLASMYAAEGEYTINGRPCRDYRYEDFRRQVTLLSQKTFVYSASIRDNLTMFSGTAQQDEALTKTLADAGLPMVRRARRVHGHADRRRGARPFRRRRAQARPGPDALAEGKSRHAGRTGSGPRRKNAR